MAPGIYEAYDYTNAPKLGTHTMPRRVVITEGGKEVMELHVDSLTQLPAADPALFVATAAMKSNEQGVSMQEARKISKLARPGRITSNTTIQPVCVFGLISPSGQLIEAHSLQPLDPNSGAAVEAAKRIIFASPTPPGGRPEQRFAFIIENFVTSQ